MAGTGLTPHSEADYAGLMAQLLPRGAAWDFAPDGPFAGLLLAFGAEFARLDARVLALVEEADPRTTLELLPDWERVAALPDSCTGAPDNVGERQVALHQKITGLGGQSRADFIEIAARIGYEIEIEEHRPFRAGMACNQPATDEAWAHAWTVEVQPPDGLFEAEEFIAHFKVGDRVGTRIRGFGSLDLECVISRAAPAHTQVIFAYAVDPEPAFWIDLTN